MARAQRAWPALDPLVFGGALVAYAVALPLGLGTVGAAGAAAGGLAPVPALLARLVALLPVGDLAARAGLAAAVAAAVATAALARLGCDLLVSMRAGAPSPAEPIAAAGAAFVVSATSAAFAGATTAGDTSATIAVVAVGWVALARVLRAPDAGGAGATLAIVVGLAVGVDAIAAPLLWPVALYAAVRALRRGERWPLVAPVLFVAGLGIAVTAVAAAAEPPAVGALIARWWPSRPPVDLPALRAATAETAEQIGVVALLLGAGGLLALAREATGAGLLVLLVGATAACFGAAGLPFVAIAAAPPIAVGIAQLAGRLGRAGVAAATALALMAVLPAALDGGAARWTRDGRLPQRLLGRAIADLPPRAIVDPGSPEMAGVFRYGAAVGLRPDLTLAPARPATRGAAGVATTP